MKVSYQWLADYIDVQGHTARELAEKLTRCGIEVDMVEERNAGVAQVVVGYVKQRDKHPDADKLSVCIVDVGQAEDLQIVCGAQNVAAGQKVPVAVIGAVLPGDFRIKRAKLRGVESQGMICSAKELGLNDKLLPKNMQEGIFVLPEDVTIGDSILDVLGLNDQVLELELTPNRSDCLSMIGTAYEIGAILGRTVQLPIVDISNFEVSELKMNEQFAVSITAKEQCSRYSARIIVDVRIGASPLWMQNRLIAAGVRPINNIVDITNYVMLEYGQPLHAFDADCISSGTIDVRLAQSGERIITLDDVERKLEPHMLLITDGDKPIAIAGVMGGANSEVTVGTTRILLESANFSGSSVRRTSRQLGLRSEASLRFEKEINPEHVIPALNRAASLIAQYAGGRVRHGIAEKVIGTELPRQITLSLNRVNSYLGTSLAMDEYAQLLDRLNFTYSYHTAEILIVNVPSRRGDITLDVDLIEEVARLYGYDNIPTTAVVGAITPGQLTKPQYVRRMIRQLLTTSGLHEAVHYSFTHPARTELYAWMDPNTNPVKLSMPMSEERSVLRTTLIPQLLDAAIYNRNRNNDDVAIFELGSVFISEEQALTQLPVEKPRLAILLTGNNKPAAWNEKPRSVDFYDLKGLIEKLTQYLGMNLEWKAAHKDGLHPGRTAEIYTQSQNGRVLVGWIGQIHPSVQTEMDLSPTYVAELELGVIYDHSNSMIDYHVLPRFPSIARDIAVVVDSPIEAGRLADQVKKIAGVWLESVEIFDVFAGERLGTNKKSVALALVYRHAERTLTDEEVSELHSQVVTSLAETFGAELRK
ncbi:MAG: phenylalanine--tRNA ligase subunit beta [Paenibacillaceae bacterium]